MPKKRPEPYWRKQTRCYYVQIGKKQYRLDPDESEAWRRYHELMANPPNKAEEVKKLVFVKDVLSAFLDWTEANQASKTFRWHRDHLRNFKATIPETLEVNDLIPNHVTSAMDKHSKWSNSTKNGFARSVQRAMRWAERQGLIKQTPIPHVEKPGRESRAVVITPAEFEDLLRRFPDQAFRDVLITCWESGCRPQEMMRVEARHVDLANNRWVFRLKESKGKKFTRIVYGV
jgi:integrase